MMMEMALPLPQSLTTTTGENLLDKDYFSLMFCYRIISRAPPKRLPYSGVRVGVQGAIV